MKLKKVKSIFREDINFTHLFIEPEDSQLFNKIMHNHGFKKGYKLYSGDYELGHSGDVAVKNKLFKIILQLLDKYKLSYEV